MQTYNKLMNIKIEKKNPNIIKEQIISNNSHIEFQ